MIVRTERGKGKGKGKGVPMPQYDVIGAVDVVLHVLHIKYCVQVHEIRVLVNICATVAIKNQIVQLVAK